MKKTIIATIGAGALLLTAACGSSDTSAETVEVDEVEIVEETTTGAPSPATGGDESDATDAEDDDVPTDVQEQLADDMAFSGSLSEVMDNEGVPADGQMEIDIWAAIICEHDAHVGRDDAEMIGHLQEDMAGKVVLTEVQATEIWKAVKASC